MLVRVCDFDVEELMFFCKVVWFVDVHLVWE